MRLAAPLALALFAAACQRSTPAAPPAPAAHQPTAQEIAAEVIRQTEERAARARTLEATDRLRYIVRAAGLFAGSEGVRGRMPPSAPRTPADVPRGTRTVDPPGTWDAEGWRNLSFAIADPHAYSYEFISAGDAFTARAYGDLDGDGVLSTFERTGRAAPDGEVTITGQRVVNELE